MLKNTDDLRKGILKRPRYFVPRPIETCNLTQMIELHDLGWVLYANTRSPEGIAYNRVTWEHKTFEYSDHALEVHFKQSIWRHDADGIVIIKEDFRQCSS